MFLLTIHRLYVAMHCWLDSPIQVIRMLCTDSLRLLSQSKRFLTISHIVCSIGIRLEVNFINLLPRQTWLAGKSETLTGGEMKELQVPELKSYEEEAAFWDNLDTADFMEDDGEWFRFETPYKPGIRKMSENDRQNRTQ